MKLITWNVNSVRLRLAGLERLLAATEADVICLQEIKADASKFPFDAIRALGFEHIEVEGIPGYHGVATLSRRPVERLEGRAWCGKQDGRYVGVRLENGVDLHNFYVPAGGDEPDPDVNDKFRHKLDFLEEMREWSAALEDRDAILVGDLNVAPLPADVWSHKQLLKVVSHTPVETDALEALRQAGGWTDLVREITPPDVPLYSWWSYRSKDWEASDRGRRLDHVWGRGGVGARLAAATVVKEARGWEKPSDHAPVLAKFSEG